MRSVKILVVDDFERFRRFVCSALQQKAQLQVSQASDGLEAIEKAGDFHPDLVVLDIGLPKLNGIESARSLLERTPTAKIMFLSQESSPDVVQAALSVGALAYVHKPRAPSDLLPAVEAVLAGKTFVSSDLEFGERMEVQAHNGRQRGDRSGYRRRLDFRGPRRRRH